MKNIFSLIAAAAVAAALACPGGAKAAQEGSAPGAGQLENLNLSDTGTLAPPPPAPAAVGGSADSDAGLVHGFTPRQDKLMSAHNATLQKAFLKSGNKLAPALYRPYADYEAPGYLIMSSEFNFDSRQAKLEMASRLPADALLVIFASNPTETAKAAILADYASVVPAARIKVISLPSARQGFWARDGIPVPVVGPDNRLTVVDAVYGHGFEPDAEISRLFKTGIERHGYYYEGGNFQANSAGDCMMVNHGRHVDIPDDVFSGMYGCKKLIRLPFIDGIGHVDERARFITEKVIVTDTPAYKDILQAKGFTVHLLPRPARYYETYVNSLIMNDRVIVPVFGEATDAQALAIYERLGLKASGANSVSLSNSGQGSVHCITMTYPKVPLAELTKALGAREF